MKKNYTKVLLLNLILFCTTSFGQIVNNYPYATNKDFLTIWNGEAYVPFFIKGTNLGVGIPGTFPGELAPTYEQYLHWFGEMKEAGFNSFRIYTLHYPRFYKALSDYNNLHPDNPLLFMQGVWLDEEAPSYNDDLNFLTTTFQLEIQDNIKSLHGKNTIPERFGKASGNYTTDVSKWCLAYIIGREVFPQEVSKTNLLNPSNTQFTGKHLKIANASPAEQWETRMMDFALDFEQTNFNTQRPISFSSWPTLDPLKHTGVVNDPEDSQQIDLSKIEIVSAPAGIFMSYHAYPYYPDFISDQVSYQNSSDNFGPNSYKGYLLELKSHYTKFPLIIAEYGVPSSWTTAHYTSSGMNHGGFDEYNQGLTDMRILQSIFDSQCGGGIQFSLTDEWFKRTWVADPLDYTPESRVLWQNLNSAEQNFGLLSFEKVSQFKTLKDNSADAITKISADANLKFLEIKLNLKDSFKIIDELWVALDTYDTTLGESLLPNGASIPNRSEFALKITNHSAELYVTEAYDTYGNWHHVSTANQLYRSTATDGKPWNIVRVKNNGTNSNADIQYIGKLQVNYDFQPYSSKDGVTIADKSIHIRLPWNYINFVAPNTKTVLNDIKETPVKEEAITDGIKINAYYKQKWFQHDDRFVWNNWNATDLKNIPEKRKVSFYVMQDNLQKFNTSAISVKDEYTFNDGSYPAYINAPYGLLKNDFDLDGTEKMTVIFKNPKNGILTLQTDGSFEYSPILNFVGTDTFQYAIYDGYSLSTPTTVVLNVKKPNLNINSVQTNINIYPNPVADILTVEAPTNFDELMIFDATGKKVNSYPNFDRTANLNLSNLPTGIYYLVGIKDGKTSSAKIIKK